MWIQSWVFVFVSIFASLFFFVYQNEIDCFSICNSFFQFAKRRCTAANQFWSWSRVTSKDPVKRRLSYPFLLQWLTEILSFRLRLSPLIWLTVIENFSHSGFTVFLITSVLYRFSLSYHSCSISIRLLVGPPKRVGGVSLNRSCGR